ncbi:tetraspanin-1-like [Aplochiton taeniatus]
MCCSGFLKMMMFIFNGGIFLAGGAILAVGIWVKVDSGSLLGILESIDDAPPELAQLANVSYLLMGVGAVLLVMGFLGCCGAIKESKCMLLTFFVIVLVIFIAEIAGAVVVLVFKPLVAELLESLEVNFIKSLRENYGSDNSLTSLWNGTMQEKIDGCFDKLVQLIEDNALVIGAVALGIAALEIAAMVVSMTLYKQIGDK